MEEINNLLKQRATNARQRADSHDEFVKQGRADLEGLEREADELDRVRIAAYGEDEVAE